MTVEHAADVAAGRSLKVRVAVTNAGAGHNLPTGFASERQLWLEVIATDGSGRRVFVSGDLDPYADLRDLESMAVQQGTAARDRELFNLQANFVLTNFVGTQSNGISTTNRLLGPVPFLAPAAAATYLQGLPSAGRIFKRGIPPLATKHATYRIRVPDDAAGLSRVRAKVEALTARFPVYR